MTSRILPRIQPTANEGGERPPNSYSFIFGIDSNFAANFSRIVDTPGFPSILSDA
jgi:hypothetical protein